MGKTKKPSASATRLAAMLKRQSDPEYIEMVKAVEREQKEIDAVVPNAEGKLSRRQATLNNAPNTGDISKLVAAEEAVEKAEKELEEASAIAKRRREVARGDYPGEDQTPGNYVEAAQAKPQAQAQPVTMENAPLADTNPAQNAATPAPVQSADADQPMAQAVPIDTWPAMKANKPSRKRGWLDVAGPYILGVMRDGQYSTAKELFRALELKAGPESPFERGTGNHRNSLFVREIGQTLSVKTLQNNWAEFCK